MKAKFRSFGFLTGFMDVPCPRYGDRMRFPVINSKPDLVVHDGRELFYPDIVCKNVVFECRGFDQDKAAIYELVEF